MGTSPLRRLTSRKHLKKAQKIGFDLVILLSCLISGFQTLNSVFFFSYMLRDSVSDIIKGSNRVLLLNSLFSNCLPLRKGLQFWF